MSEQDQKTAFRDLPKRRGGPGGLFKWLLFALLLITLLGFGVIGLLRLKQAKNPGDSLFGSRTETPLDPEDVPETEPANPATPITGSANRVPTPPEASTGSATKASPETPEAPEPPTPPPPPPEPEDPAMRAHYKAEMEKVLGKMLKKQKALETMLADEWGGAAYTNGLELVKAGDSAWQDSRFKAASESYNEALRVFEAVDALKAGQFRRYMRRGAEAMEAGDGNEARAAYNAAATINPDEEAAIKGAARAKNIDRVHATFAKGQSNEAAGKIALALADYTIAKTIDPDFTPAVEAHARVQGMVVENKFQVAMAEGIAAFENGDFEEAKRIVEAGRAFQPENTQIDDTLKMIEQGILDRKLSEVRSRADASLMTEDFDTAIDLYNEALTLQPNVEFARVGAKRAADALALWQDVDRYLLEPERINNRNGLANATELVIKAVKFPNPGPALRTKIATLQGMVSSANAQIAVTITSDGLTSVDVYRVGRFGAIRSRSITVRPGTYTAMGRREGYRDVRVVFTVKNGAQPPPVDVRCTQPIR